MDFDLSPKLAQIIFDGEGGSYYGWSGSDFPLLGEAKVGAGRLLLQPYGFVLPHYADSTKVGYVLQGTDGIVGMVLPNSSQEVVLKLRKGDVIPVPLGSISWWYNNGDSQFDIVFLGETSKSYIPGEFTYFLLTGGRGILAGFSSEFTSRAYNLNQNEATKLAKSQTGALIIKLEAGENMPQPDHDHITQMVYNIDAASPDVDVKRGGTFKKLRADKFGFLQATGLSVNHVKLDANAMYAPSYTADGTVQVFYAAKGMGRMQIVGFNGELALDSIVKAGELLLVPKFFVAATIAGDEGLELISIITTTSPVVEEFVEKKSVWSALSPKAAQISLDVNSDFRELFVSNVTKNTLIIPPTN